LPDGFTVGAFQVCLARRANADYAAVRPQYGDAMDINDALALSTTNFLSLLDLVRDSDMSSATPCEDWSVRDLIAHVAQGSDMCVALLNGAPKDEASRVFAEPIAHDVLGACRRALAAQLDATSGVRELDQIVHHPMGDISVRQLFDFRIGDLTLHAWDLARAIDASEELPEDLVEHVYAMLLPMETFIGTIGVFGAGPSGQLDDGSTTQQRLLDLVGRRP